MAFFLAYSFCASSMWPLTGQDLHAAQSTAGIKLNWNVAGAARKAQNALTTSALKSAGPLAPNAAATSPAIAASSVLSAAGTGAASPFDGGSSSCTVHTSQPSSDSDDGDNSYSTYARHDYKYGSTDQASGVTPAVVASGVTVFGPQTFVRTTGPPNEFDSTITVPAWIAQPFYLHVVNGDSSGNHRVSSATVSINGVALLVPSDFNQQVASADCAVNLTVPTSALHVELASKPGSFLTINLLGQNQDHTPPTLSITAPANGSTVNTTTPHIALSYSDVKGATEPAASGVNVPSLKVLLDGVDRTSLFTERPNDASADVPSSLALSQGPHTITATIQDNAGNTATATSQFQVVTQSALVLQIVQPAAGAFLNSLTVPVQITYSDNVSINTSTLKVTVNGVDRTSAFTVTASGATGTVTGQQGANQIVASISDVSSQQATASAAFNIDTVPPVLTIQAPPPGSTHGSSTVAYSVQYSDDQALDLTSLKISVDGTALAVTPGPNSASGTVTLADGNHTLTALIKDKTGNQTPASSTFSVDTTAPSIHIVQPTPGAIQNVATLQVQVTYGDNENINTGSLKIAIDGADETSFFTVTATGASASLAGPFAEGSHTITAQIADQTGNLGQASSTFVVDTIKPALTIVSPVGPINTASPTALAQYSDSGTGINTNSVHVFVDGSDVTSGFSIGNASVTGTVTGLSEGTHQFRVTVADRAGNVADQSVSFLVDVTPPAVSFTSPANNVFINNTQPSVTLNYSDSGSGINQNSIHIFLQAGSSPETEITSAFTLGASQANGTIGTPTPLAPGTYHLRAQVLDNAGNSSTAISAFQVDTQPPTYVIQLPAANSFLNTATPALLVTYQDDASGVDPSQFAIRVDGIDRTNRLTVTATSASGTLLPADALADGTHQVEVTVVDRAGNSAPVVPQSFLVDTTPPTISISTPVNGGFTNNNLFPISVSYADSGSGIDATKFQLTIDGVDQTAQFTITPTGATGTPAAVLPNGLHTVTATIKDLAGNPSIATAAIVVSTVPPQITITQPANGTFTNVPLTPISISYSGSGSGVDVTTLKVLIDGVDQTAQFTVTATGATGSPAAALPDGLHTITASIKDLAGNPSPATTTFTVDTVPPQITITQPAPGSFTNATSLVVTGSVMAASPVTVTVDGIAATVQNNTFTSAAITLGTNATQTIPVVATDAARNSSTFPLIINIDRTPPTITGAINPPPNAAKWNNKSVTVSFTCFDSGSGVASCTGPVPVTTEGANQQVTGTAVDNAGNIAQTTVTVNIDETPPVVTASAAPPPNGNGWNNTNVTVTFTCTDNLSGVAICPQAPPPVMSEGQNQNISGQATDVAGNVATGGITLNIDKTPPTIVQLSTPDHVSKLQAGQITVTANDNFTVTQVVISVNGTSLGTFTTAPYQAALQVPAGANPGDTLTVTAVATDEAGNTQTASRTVRVAADGVIVGQVLSDATSFPIQGAVVQAISTTATSDQTDDHGRYSLQANDPHLFLSATSASPATTTVEREVFVQEGVGTVPVDARLTPLAAPMAIGSAGGTLTAGNISITVPAGAVGDGTTFQLTPLTGQGLPGLLPLGWSPLAAFDFRASSSAMNLSATVSQLPNTVLHLATYSPALHAWTMVATNLQVVSGGVALVLPSSGAYALVVPDVVIPPITIPNPGSALTGIAMQLLDPAASSSGSLSPAILPPTGGTSTATLGVQTTAAVPSGTVIQANVSEKFSLTSGDVVSEENRSEDIVIYNALAPANSTLGAQFAVTPSRKYTNTQLLTGKVHLDILAGREGVRGQPGGSDPVTLTDGIATLAVPGGALSQDTVINVQGISLEDFVPTNGSIGALQEVLVDFSGETLNTPGQLSISSNGLNPAHTFFLTQVQRIDGIPHIALVALAQISGGSLTSVASPGLPGITQGGEYVFYDVSASVGFVQGIVSSSAGPVQALVQTDSLPVVSITGANGQYIVPAIAGTANLKANSPHTNLTGSVSVQVTGGQTTQANIVLAGTVTSAVVAPADGTLGVPVSTTITITTTAALNPQSISQANLVLLQGNASSGTPVPVTAFVLSSSGTVLSFAPVSNLNPATQYTIQVAGLADTFGGAVVVPTSSFTTKAVAPLNFDPNALTFSFPDQNGNIQVTAPAGSLPPGTQILIVDQTSGLVLSLTALNDGSVSGNFPGTVDDVTQVTLTDPNGATASFTRSQFVASDGTTAVGSGGGTVTGSGGTGLIIPPGAVSKGTTFKVTLLDQSAFPVLPSFPGSIFGSGLHVDAPSMPAFNEEVKLVFPVPANAPSNAFYYVYRRLTDQDGNVYFDTIDHAFVQGTGANARVVTASPPFCGYRNSYGKVQKDASGILTSIFTAFVDFILVFEIPVFDTNEPGVASQGLIVGKALQITPPQPGQTQTTFLPVGGAVVSLDSDTSRVATTDANCGTFALLDPQLGGGLRHVTISNNGKQLKADVNEVNAQAEASAQDALFGPFGVTAGLEALYKNIGTVNFTFPPPLVVIPPQINITVYTLDGNNQRQPIKGIVTSGTPLVITFATNQKLTLTGLSINQTQYAFGPDTLGNFTDNLNHYVVTQNYSAGEPGVYKIVATAQDPLDPSVLVTEGKSFLVVNAANGQLTVTPGVAPAVIDTTPTKNAVNVPTTTFPEISFSEPVTNVTGSVTLIGAKTGDSPELLLIGLRADGSIANPVSPTDAITSLTVQPVSGLQFNEQYTLTLASTIVDQNSPPLPLPTFALPFTTAGGQELGGTPPDDSFSATRPVVIGNRAYLGVVDGSSTSGLDIVDISDPTTPKDQGIRALFLGHVLDATGQKDSPVSRCRVVNAGQPCTPGQGGGLVAVAAGQPGIDLILPSNVYVYDVSTPDVPNRVGAVSVTTSNTQDGMVVRLFMKDQFLYTSTFLKGIQVVDLQQALNDYADGFGTNPVQFGQDITTEGVGFANDSVVNTIPLRLPACANNAQPCQPVMSNGSPLTFSATMWDLKAGDFAVNSSTQTLVVATGIIPFVVVDPLGVGQSAVFFPPSASTYLINSPLQFQQQFTDGTTGMFAMQVGRAVALGTYSVPDGQGGSTTKQVAVLVGVGSAPPLPDGTSAGGMLMVIDMTDPHNPATIGAVQLSEVPVDVILKGPIALIGTGDKKVLLVNLNDPTHPIAAGEIDGPTLGDHLALTDSGIIISSSPNPVIGGVHTAGLESECVTQRNNLKNSGPSIANISYPLKSLDWTIGGGAFTLEDGYVLTAVQLGDRLMANTMSLPYVTINRTPAGGSPTTMQCVLSSNTPSGACMGSPTSRSQQLSLTYFPSAGDQFAIEAKFLLDRLDGDPDQDPTKPDSCVILTQHYEFWREGFDAPEASDELSAARFKPTVTYQYFTGTNGPKLNLFTAAQRFQFSPTAFTVNDVTAPKPFSYPPSSASIATLFLDCEPSEFVAGLLNLITPIPNPGCLNILDLNHLGTATPNGNPIPQEISMPIIKAGAPVFGLNRADNLHLRAYGGTTDIAGPTTAGHPGCPECVHIHWRWGSNLERSSLVGAAVVSPRFDNNGGMPIIPFGSNQDVDIGVLHANIGGGHGTEEHPAFGQTYLTFVQQQPISTGVALSFWYSATGFANQDSFMVHGGFFSSLKVTIGNPAIFSSNALALPLNLLDCSGTFSAILGCPVTTDIKNRTGHKVRWTATLTDKSGTPVAAIKPTTGEINGAPNLEYDGTATIYLPPGITLFPTYILDIKVVDEVTNWSTERQAFVTSGIQIILPPIVP